MSLGTHCPPCAFLRTKTLPRITIETWSFQSTCGMPTRSGLAKAYKHVTTQVTLVQKQAPKPLGKLVLGKDKRKSVTHKLFRVYKPLICAEGSRSCTRSNNEALLRLPLCLKAVVQPRYRQTSQTRKRLTGSPSATRDCESRPAEAMSRQIKKAVHPTQTVSCLKLSKWQCLLSLRI